MNKYKGQPHFLLAIDCIIFGFDGKDIKLLLVQRGFEPEKNMWSLMGGFLEEKETLDEAANRILKKLTGLENIYLEQLHTFSKVNRDPVERTVSASYFALIDIERYKKQISHEYHAEWFLINNKPRLIFDHDEMVMLAQKQLRFKAAIEPLLFELLPDHFTITQLQNLYEGVYETAFDKRNFIRKLMSTGLLIKLPVKDKSGSRKGAFLYQLDKSHYQAKLHIFLTYITDMSYSSSKKLTTSPPMLRRVG